MRNERGEWPPGCNGVSHAPSQSLATFSLALLFIAGGRSASPIAAAAPDDFDPRAVLDDAARYQGPGFSHVSADVSASALGNDTAIDVYASTTAVAQYELISPEVSGSRSVVAEGGLIVRAVVDAGTGKPQRLTVMGKGPAGYNPDLEDWFFAVKTMATVAAATDPSVAARRLERRETDAHLGAPVSRLRVKPGCGRCRRPRTSGS